MKMNSVKFSFLVLLCGVIGTTLEKIGCAKAHPAHPAATPMGTSTISGLEDDTDSESPMTSLNFEPEPLTTTIPSPQDDLDDISIQDILSSDIDASDKIEKKIINAITEFSSNCNIYKRMELSLSNFTFPKKTINIDLGIGHASFYNFAIVEESNTVGNKLKTYSTLIGCDSSRKAKVEVSLPTNIKISANIKIIEVTEPSDGLVSQSMNEGSISILLKNNSISKQFFVPENDKNNEENIRRKISYSKTEVYLDIRTKYQKLIYTNLEEILSEIESSVEQHFVDQLNAQLSKNGIAVGESCSKFINMQKNSKKINLSFLNNDFNNLYVIQNVSLDTWKGISLSAGPIVIKGISHFNSTELSVSGTELSSPSPWADGQYLSTPRYDDPERKDITVRIKTNGLKGKLDWSYNSKQRSFPFSIDFILFEIKKNKVYRYTSVYSRYGDYRYSRSDENKMNVDLHMGNIQIKSSKSSVCENEKEFVNFVLSEYLKTIVKDSLKNSLDKKLQNNPSVVNC